jgi:hypothetical protein
MPLCHDAFNAGACATRSSLPLQSRGVPCAVLMSLARAPMGTERPTFLDGCCFSERAMLLVLPLGPSCYRVPPRVRATREHWLVLPWRETVLLPMTPPS